MAAWYPARSLNPVKLGVFCKVGQEVGHAAFWVSRLRSNISQLGVEFSGDVAVEVMSTDSSRRAAHSADADSRRGRLQNRIRRVIRIGGPRHQVEILILVGRVPNHRGACESRKVGRDAPGR